MTLTRANNGLAAQLRYLNEMLGELAGRVGATSDDLTECQNVESELCRAVTEHRDAAERVALAKARLDAAEALLAQAATAEAQAESQCRARVGDMLQNLAARPSSRQECVRSLQTIFSDDATAIGGPATDSMPAPVPGRKSFWNKLFTLEPASEEASYKLFTVRAVTEPVKTEAKGTPEPPLPAAFVWQERAVQ